MSVEAITWALNLAPVPAGRGAGGEAGLAGDGGRVRVRGVLAGHGLAGDVGVGRSVRDELV